MSNLLFRLFPLTSSDDFVAMNEKIAAMEVETSEKMSAMQAELSEKIIVLQNQMKEQMKEQMGYLREREDEINAQIERLDQRCSALEAVATEVHTAISVMNEQIGQMQGQESEKSARMEHLDQRCSALEAVATEVQESISRITVEQESVIKNLQNNNSYLETVGENLNNVNHILDMQTTHNACEAELEGYRIRLEQLGDKVEMLLTKFLRLEKERAKLANSEVRVCVEAKENTDFVSETVENNSENVYTEIDYFDFENYFRGTREHVKRVQEIYVPYFEGCDKVIDIGCGRGEFLELLKENQIGAKGVDY